jgi:MoxR-like ATPase
MEEVMNTRESILKIGEAMNAAIIGQETVVERLLIAFLADGHILMEGLPGVAKTRSIKTLGTLVESVFRRVQFTPDLLPSDVTGSEIYREHTASFDFQQGPIFGNLVLADEINRAPAKVQAALLEAMEERQITVSGTTHALPQLFLVLATQNPIEQEGTYPLPEAQMDRFLLYVNVPYPPAENESAILRLVRSEKSGKRHAARWPRSMLPRPQNAIWSTSSSAPANPIGMVAIWQNGSASAPVPAVRSRSMLPPALMPGCRVRTLYRRTISAPWPRPVWRTASISATKRKPPERPERK